MNEIYSYKDFTGQDLSEERVADFNNSTIVGSCFAQEVPLGHAGSPMKDTFPPTMTGVTFEKCNLDNCVIPVGNTVEVTSINRKIQIQNDLEDWFLDGSNNPTSPISKPEFERLGISTDPADIPTEPLTRRITDV